MICPDSTRASEVEHLNAVLTMLTSEAFAPASRSHDLEAGSAAPAPVDASADCAASLAPSRAYLPGSPADLSVDEWDLLFEAVRARLRLVVGECPTAQPEAGAHGSADPVRAGVLECVDALDHLHTLLQQLRGPRLQPAVDRFGA